ncbi:PREDICTED: putative nuclease HARBI1 [Fragaria vesca subsp. vesca]|uniref:putative nuclease HARBI1 n=1 Tax=Fragaria vesca subsp. vesca TaxID=101020 RepID=UPI0002C36283|nr:PREDICTED: putative nuclease HARBI1 [Fragaria vesca subsp. vesca]
MESSTLVALLSSVSQLLLLLVLSPNPSSSSSSFPAVHHLLSSQELAATLSLLSLSRKRKRARLSSPTQLLPRSPDSFKTHFRMTSSTFEWLCSLLEPLLECRDPVGSSLNLSADLRLGIGLFRLATGANYHVISQQFRVSETVARFCSKQLCRVLCTNYRFWIEFPDKSELQSVSAGFEAHTGLPNCCGVIDCARFRVVRDNGVEQERVAAQIMVDATSRILSIVAGFRGSKSDDMVLKCSTLYADIERGELLNLEAVSVDGVPVNQYLVGGGGYPLLPWLMVPFVDAMPGSNEEQFNVAHSRMRLSGLRVVDSLKNWGVLSRPIREEMKMAVAYIGACAILHNGLLMREDYSAMSGGLDDYSLYDQSSRYYRDDTSLEESSIERRASVIRNALATKAKEFQESILSANSSSLASLEST